MYRMCQQENCKYIEYYELDQYGTKIYIHFDKCYNPLWMEYVKRGESLGEFYPKTDSKTITKCLAKNNLTIYKDGSF